MKSLHSNEIFFRSTQANEKTKFDDIASGCDETQARRCFEHDPCMMREVLTYRKKLMLLTILPNIATDTKDIPTALHPHSHLQPPRDRITPTPPIDPKTSHGVQRLNVKHQKPAHLEKKVSLNQAAKSLQPESSITKILPLKEKVKFSTASPAKIDDPSEDSDDSFDTDETMHNFSFVSANGGTSEQLSQSVGCIGSGGLAAANARKKIKSACSESRLPATGESAAASPAERNTNFNEKKSGRRVSVMPGDANGLSETDTSELDLLTLAELYLESRHRVFGDEWNQR